MPETSRREEPFEKQHIVRRKCSWCGKDLGTAGYMSSEEGEVSGGMCTECRERETKKLLEGKENNKKQYPVILQAISQIK
ncbi:MAG: hypothetical protein NT094_02855 [Candidatus Staskawiczbacteria bacterium]|nr:hypothetical protein [Candidatus Staskawiczbacteria bacterium]